MAEWNFVFGWCWILVGLAAGAITGMWFHQEDWVGGYPSWPRRMVRLGHIAFLGSGILNVLMARSLLELHLRAGPWPLEIGGLLIVGAVAMPTVCYLSAWRKKFRHLFALPVICLIGGTGTFCVLTLLHLFR